MPAGTNVTSNSHAATAVITGSMSDTQPHGTAEPPSGEPEASLINETVLGPINASINRHDPLLDEQRYRANTPYDSFDHWLGDFSISDFDQDNFLHSWCPSLLPGTDSISVNPFSVPQSEQVLDGWTPGSRSPLQTIQTLETSRSSTHPITSIFNSPSPISNNFTASFPRARRQWHLRGGQPQSSVWMALPGDGTENEPSTNSVPCRETFLQRRRFDEDTRARLKDAIRTHQRFSQLLPQQATGPNYKSFSSVSTTSSQGDMPPAGLLDIALDVYFAKCDPTIPIIHHATFSARTAPTCLLLSLVLTGFNTLGTKGAVSYVRNLLPTLLSMVLRQLEKECTVGFQDASWLATMSAATVLSNMAILLQHQGNEEGCRTVFFVTTVLLTARNAGIFSVRVPQSNHESITYTDDVQDRWLKWSRIESARRLANALIDLNLSFSALYGRRPLVLTDDVSIISPSADDVFWTETSSEWLTLVQGETPKHRDTISLSSCATTGDDWSVQTARGFLTLLQSSLWETYHSFHTLRFVVQLDTRIHPWQACETLSERDLVRLTLSLSPYCIRSSDGLNINDAVSWHLTCLMLAANCQNMATALRFAGDGAANFALEDIKSWAMSPTARRACLHAGEIFATLFHRRIRESVTLHTVCGAFWAGLVMGLYYLNVPSESATRECDIDLISRFDWQAIETAGLAKDAQHPRGESSSPIGVSAKALEFIAAGGTPRISGDYHPGGHVTARRIFSHFADLIDGLGTWRLPILSQVLRAASEDLMDMDSRP
ncbi:uncharacterized protein A1O9_00546 [Exophiala aquamarina CBS 119918]|uniref:Transcription factor domain-containing protein n=1 Tax=Exophiala aquamarina CBS 119918 TaxID=1182545 RepID=A0A072PT95_9EURO|nr:uncharacterized protein A1O9_00546 [Exophiala aquamarina CBS 119918]KEF62573.1 hypothetical protein A1O9_00546 [Exophiala aquamarina CBS 119918]